MSTQGLFKDIGLITLARVLVIVCQFINIKLYTNYFSAEQLGFYFFLLTLSYFANALIFSPVDYYQQANLAKMIQSTGGVRPFLVFNRKLAMVYFIVTLLGVVVTLQVSPHYVPHIILGAVLAIALHVVQSMRNTLNNLEHRGDVSFALVQEAIIKIMVLLVLLKFFVSNELLLIVAWVIALAVTAITLSSKMHKYRLFVAAKEQTVKAKEVFYFSYPISIGAVCNWLQQQGYRLVLVPLGFAEEVGVFATISGIGSAAIGAVSLIYSQQFTPLIYKTDGQYTSKYLRGAIAVILVVTLVSYGLGGDVVKLLTHTNFEPHWKLLLFGVITDGGYLLIGALAIHITLSGKTKQIIATSLLGLLVMIVGFIFLYFIGEVTVASVGVPLLVAQCAVVCSMYFIYQKSKVVKSRASC